MLIVRYVNAPLEYIRFICIDYVRSWAVFRLAKVKSNSFADADFVSTLSCEHSLLGTVCRHLVAQARL